MVIQTISQGYRVIRRLYDSDQVKGYVCLEQGDLSKTLFLLVELNDPMLSKKMIPYFMELNTRENKGDFINCFVNGGSLWLIFRYYRYPFLYSKAKDDLRLKERLEASRTMVEQILIQNLPFYLQYEALNPRNIVVSDVPEVHFNFLLSEPDLLDECSLLDVQKRLASCLKALFAPELEKETVPELANFIMELQEKDYTGYSEIYRDYRKLYGLMDSVEEAEQPYSKNILLRIWKGLKGLYNVLKKVLYAAVLLVLVGMIIYIIVKPETTSDHTTQFNRIGTLDIRQENGDGNEAQ